MLRKIVPVGHRTIITPGRRCSIILHRAVAIAESLCPESGGAAGMEGCRARAYSDGVLSRKRTIEKLTHDIALCARWPRRKTCHVCMPLSCTDSLSWSTAVEPGWPGG